MIGAFIFYIYTKHRLTQTQLDSTEIVYFGQGCTVSKFMIILIIENVQCTIFYMCTWIQISVETAE